MCGWGVRAELFCWAARVESTFCNIACYHCACADDDIIADMDRQNGRIAAYADIAAYVRAFPLAFVCCWCAGGKGIVDKHHAVSYEAVIAYARERADEAMALDPAVIPDIHIALDFDKWTDEDIIAKGAFIEIDRCDDMEIFSVCNITDTRSLCGDSDLCGRMGEILASFLHRGVL